MPDYSAGMFRLVIIARALVLPLILYVVSGLMASYFVWHGVNGQRGLKAGVEFEARLNQLRHERDLLKFEHMQWEKRIALMRGETIDADLLDEEARIALGRSHKNDVVILTAKEKS